MKKNIIALVCTAFLAVLVIVPVGLSGMLKPQEAVSNALSVHRGEVTVPEKQEESVSVEPDYPGGEPNDEPEYEQGVIIVGIGEGVGLEQFNERLAQLDYIATDRVGEQDLAFGYALLNLEPGIGVEDAMERMQGEAVVASAEPNYVLHVQDYSEEDRAYAAGGLQVGSIDDEGLEAQAAGVNDPYAKDQWALGAINAYEAWEIEKAQDKNPKVTVAVLDSGMNVNHPDFAGVDIVDKRSFVDHSNESLNDNSSSIAYSSDDITDYYGHGTHVAGIIAAGTNNATGVAGMSYNARIMPVQVIKSNGGTSVWLLVKGLNYVAQRAEADKVKVVNISIGSKDKWTSGMPASYQTAVQSVHNKGILIVYAAGNYANSLGGAYSSFPCDVDTSDSSIGVISVEERSGSYARSSFSNYNEGNSRTKKISAPGSSILSTAISGDKSAITYYRDSNGVVQQQYGYKSGTSMAAPYVSAVAALVFSEYPELTPAQVAGRLCDTANDFDGGGFTDETGYGLVDALAALSPPTKNPNIAIEAIPAYSYTGSAITPAVTVRLNGSLLSADYYTVRYSNNVNAGTATVRVTLVGTNASAGYQEATFKITPVSLSGATVQIADQTYNGAALQPTPTVKLGGKTLTLAKDYAVSYGNNLNAGTATATIVGKGNYTGTASGSFTVNKARLSSIVLSQTSVTYNGAQQSPTVYVYGPKDGRQGQVLSMGADYTLSTPAGRVNAGSYTYTATGNGGNYTADSLSATLTINKLNIANATITLGQTAYTYDGTAKAPSVTVKSGSRSLKAGTDYKSTFSDNVNAGHPSVKVEALGSNCYGSTTRSYTISKAAITSITLSQTSYVYDGSAKTPGVTVLGPKNGRPGQVLSAASDYTVRYSNNVNGGTATVHVTGQGNYAGTQTADFTITGGPATVEPSVQPSVAPSAEPSSSVSRVDVYRLYNPYNGDHHYTTSADERNVLSSIGWNYEGVAWTAPSASSTPVYRLYNPYSGDHHYTTSADERNSLDSIGWNYEGVAWHSDDAQGMALYRLYNRWLTAGTHHYTTSADERDYLASIGWKYEGVAWHGLA